MIPLHRRAGEAKFGATLRGTSLAILVAGGIAGPAPGAEPPPGRGTAEPEGGIPETAAPADSLDGLVAEALRNHPEVRAARREREAALQRARGAGALDDPMLEAGVLNFPVESRRFDAESMTMKMLGISQRLPYPGKRDLRREVAARDAESAEFGYRETLNRVAREVRMAYLDFGLAVEAARLTEQNRSVLEQIARLAESRYAVGQGSQADALKARTQLSRMADELIRLHRERHGIEADLNRALGRAAESPAPPPEPPRLDETPLALDALREAALRNRPQILGLQSLVAKSDKALALARREFYPDFDVRFSYGQRETLRGGIRQEDMVNLTVAVNLPVWRDRKLKPRVEEAVALREQAADLLDARINELGARLRHEIGNAEQYRKSARLYETTILPQARLAVEAALAAYRANRSDLLALLDSRMAVFRDELNHAAALAGYRKALAELDFLTGKPATGDFAVSGALR